MSKQRPINEQMLDTREQSKAGVIRQASADIEAWREAGISTTAIARRLSERSQQTITAADVYRETYRFRRRRKKEPLPAPQVQQASPPSSAGNALAPSSGLAQRLRERDSGGMDFNPKPNADDLI